jgi:hypothetical protein
VREFGRGFEVTNLTRMMNFAEAVPDPEIVATLSQQLSWSHFRELLPLSQPLQREFYAEMSRIEGWSVRTLRGRTPSPILATPSQEFVCHTPPFRCPALPSGSDPPGANRAG